MRAATRGDFQVADVRGMNRRCMSVCAAAFVAGLFLGAYAAHAVFARSEAPVARALVDVGDYLCKQWDGLAEIGRVGQSRYAFRCHSLAAFPDVEITMAGREP